MIKTTEQLKAIRDHEHITAHGEELYKILAANTDKLFLNIDSLVSGDYEKIDPEGWELFKLGLVVLKMTMTCEALDRRGKGLVKPESSRPDDSEPDVN